jgi:hypothetical protein
MRPSAPLLSSSSASRTWRWTIGVTLAALLPIGGACPRAPHPCRPDSAAEICSAGAATCGTLDTVDNCGNEVVVDCGSCATGPCHPDHQCGPFVFPECGSNDDCAQADAGMPVCDQTTERCTECLTTADCGPNQTCVLQTCQTAPGSCVLALGATCPSPGVVQSVTFFGCFCPGTSTTQSCEQQSAVIGPDGLSCQESTNMICTCQSSVCLLPCTSDADCPSQFTCGPPAGFCVPMGGVGVCAGGPPACGFCDRR